MLTLNPFFSHFVYAQPRPHLITSVSCIGLDSRYFHNYHIFFFPEDIPTVVHVKYGKCFFFLHIYNCDACWYRLTKICDRIYPNFVILVILFDLIEDSVILIC